MSVRFKLQPPTKSYRRLVERGSVLYRLFRSGRAPALLHKRVQQIGSLWRRRLHELARVGWYAGADEKDSRFSYAINCLPAFVGVLPVTRRCTLRTICPYCWAREAVDLWDRLNYCLPELQPKERKPRPPAGRRLAFDTCERPEPPSHVELPHWDVIERCHRYFLPFSDHPAHVAAARAASLGQLPELPPLADVPLADMEDRLRRCLRDVIGKRLQFLADRRLPHAHLRTIVYPVRYGWCVEQRQLFLLVPGQPYTLSDFGPTAVRCERHSSLRRRDLVAIVCRTMAYPRELLRGDPAHVALLMRARRRLRLVASFGEFREHRST